MSEQYDPSEEDAREDYQSLLAEREALQAEVERLSEENADLRYSQACSKEMQDFQQARWERERRHRKWALGKARLWRGNAQLCWDSGKKAMADFFYEADIEREKQESALQQAQECIREMERKQHTALFVRDLRYTRSHQAMQAALDRLAQFLGYKQAKSYAALIDKVISRLGEQEEK